MALWTDIIEPAELTGYVRASMEEREQAKGSLARWLPNTEVHDSAVRLTVGEHGLVSEARFRAFDAEIETGVGQGGRRVTVDLQPLGKDIPITEQEQLRSRNSSNELAKNLILKTADNVAASIADRIERLRGTVLATGKATINQENLAVENDFGRDADMSVVAAVKWDQANAKVLEDLAAWCDRYESVNGETPGVILLGRRAARALMMAPEFKTVLAGGGARPGSMEETQAILSAQGLPPIEVFTRKTKGGLVIPENTLLLLPEAGDVNGMSELGATYFGQTLSSEQENYGLADSEMPGIVAGVYRGEKPPHIAEVIGDSLALPVLADANLAMAAEVLS